MTKLLFFGVCILVRVGGGGGQWREKGDSGRRGRENERWVICGKKSMWVR